MNSKKILIVGLILLIAVSSISLISAAEKLSINGIDFTIPDGYSESDHGSIFSESLSMAFYENSNNESISLSVVSADDDALDTLKESGYVDKTIAGKKGVIFQSPVEVQFAYMEGDKLIKVFAPDEETIEIVLSGY